MKTATREGWTIVIHPDGCRGYFERDRDGCGGGLWFSVEATQEIDLGPGLGALVTKTQGTLTLIDYDGVFSLPRPVFEQLKEWGVVMEDIHDPDYFQ